MSITDQALQQLDRLGAIILDDVGDGPAPADFAAAARAARDAIAPLAVPALTQLGGLISGVAESVVAGATEWNPALGGTLIAAVDDLRHLASRASQFTDEDNEHLAHRASELTAYVRTEGAGRRAEETVAEGAGRRAEETVAEGAGRRAEETVTEGAGRRAEETVTPASVAEPPPSALEPPASVDTNIVPISDLFYADNGPHIVSGGMSREAEVKSDLLGKGIDALDHLTMKPLATPVTFGAMEVVPVETLLYRGRSALERAAAIREQIKASGGVASPETIEEMFDLIGLALKD